jgi:DNA replication and repair protein RecF
VRLRGFRNLADADLALPAGGFVMAGPNGHGKTSLIEALVYCRLFRSFRGAADREVVRFGADGFHVAVESERAGEPGSRAIACGYDARTRKKKVTLDGAEAPAPSRAIGMVGAVVLSPWDVALVSGAPRERRAFMDMVLALTVRGYLASLLRYRRALAQRMRSSDGDAEAFEVIMAEAGAEIVAARGGWAARWREVYRERCAALGERDAASLDYQPRTAGDTGQLRRAFSASRSRDRAQGRTSVGPHRDELRLGLAGREVRTWGSAGQQRTAALALRLLEAATLAETAHAPLLCLDDAFAELDEQRSARLGTVISGLAAAGSQVVAAVPRADGIPAALEGLERWCMNSGVVSRQ